MSGNGCKGVTAQLERTQAALQVNSGVYSDGWREQAVLSGRCAFVPSLAVCPWTGEHFYSAFC